MLNVLSAKLDPLRARTAKRLVVSTATSDGTPPMVLPGTPPIMPFSSIAMPAGSCPAITS